MDNPSESALFPSGFFGLKTRVEIYCQEAIGGMGVGTRTDMRSSYAGKGHSFVCVRVCANR